MKQHSFLLDARHVFAACVIALAGFAAVRAQVIPLVCFEAKPETLTRSLTNSFCVGSTSTVTCNLHSVGFSPGVPLGYYTVIFNPGPTQDILYGYGGQGGLLFLGSNGLPVQSFSFAHEPGETVLAISEGDAVYGYNNLSSTTVGIPKGVLSGNFFSPGPVTYATQPSVFLPGVHGDVFRLKVIPGAPAATWFLNGGEAIPNVSAGQGCATITYQGRLSDAGNAASGQYDLQFQAFEAVTGGTAQSELITREDVQVTNGVFTVPLFFGSTFINNFKPRFLQIGVRPGTAPNTDPFTVLTPRQPLTQVPYAVNAQTAQTAFDVRLQLTSGAPPAGDCNETVEHGRMKFDAGANRLYICTATGWKAFVPEVS